MRIAFPGIVDGWMGRLSSEHSLAVGGILSCRRVTDGVAGWIRRREVGKEGQEGDRGMMALALGRGRLWLLWHVCLACLATLAVWLAGSRLVFLNPHPHYCPRRKWMDSTGWSESVGSSGASVSLVLCPLISHLLTGLQPCSRITAH